MSFLIIKLSWDDRPRNPINFTSIICYKYDIVQIKQYIHILLQEIKITKIIIKTYII